MTARENAETADLTLEVERLRGELEALKLEHLACKPLYSRRKLEAQLAEATGLLNGWCENFNVHWQPQALKDNSEAFLSRAPAQAAEPCARCKWADGCKRAEDAESKLAAARELLTGVHVMHSQDAGQVVCASVAEDALALLAPSQGEGGGGNG